jgi:hypothetical protein
MPLQCLITGTVKNPDNSISSGRLTIYLRAPKMSVAQVMVLDKPVSNITFNATGEISFNLQPNSQLLPIDSFYEVHVFTRKSYWVERWQVPDVSNIDIVSLKQGTNISSSFFVEEVSHEADVYNPHGTTIEEVLLAQPDYIIPAGRLDFTGATVTSSIAPLYSYLVLIDGEDTFILPVTINTSSPEDIQVTLNGLEQTGGGPNDFRIINSSTIQFNRTLYNGELVEIRVLKTA